MNNANFGGAVFDILPGEAINGKDFIFIPVSKEESIKQINHIIRRLKEIPEMIGYSYIKGRGKVVGYWVGGGDE